MDLLVTLALMKLLIAATQMDSNPISPLSAAVALVKLFVFFVF